MTLPERKLLSEDWIACATHTPTDGDAHHVILEDKRDGRRYHALASYPTRQQDCNVPLVDGWRIWYIGPTADDETRNLEHLAETCTVTHWRDMERLHE